MALEGESTAQVGSTYRFSPRNFRDMIQKQISHTVDRQVTSAVDLSIGGFDGRQLGNFPGVKQQLQDTDGKFYHVVGFNRGGDLSIAAP
jgi:hypothetical protein